MNKEQKQIYLKFKSKIKKARKDYLRLKKLNEDPQKQYYWDDWMRASGFESGLEAGFLLLTEFIKREKIYDKT